MAFTAPLAPVNPDNTPTPDDDLITYQEAARILGIALYSTRQLVTRGRLHAVPDPSDRRRRLVSRREVEARAAFTARHPTGVQTPLYGAPPPLPAPSDLLKRYFPDATPQQVIAGAAGIGVLLALLLLATSGGAAPIYRGIMAGGVAALGIAILAELYAQGRISDQQRYYLEGLARQAEAEGNPQPFIAELRRVLPEPAA